MKSTVLENERGGTMLYLLVFGTLLGMAGLMVPRILQRQITFSADDRMKFEASIVAQNMIEVGKWLMLYEPVFYLNDPLRLRGNANTARRDCVQGMWSQNIGTQEASDGDMRNACGFYDATGSFDGTGRIRCAAPAAVNEEAICPAMIRNELMSGSMFQDLVLSQWSGGNLGIWEEGPPGVFAIEIDMMPALNPANQDQLSVPLFYNERFINEIFDGNFGIVNNIAPDFLNPLDPPFQAVLRIEMLSNSSNFIANASERFLRFAAQITFVGKRGIRHRIERNQVMMITPSTARDFSIFLAYPARTIPDANYGDITTSFSEAVRNPSSDVNVYGRTFFHGDIDIPLENIPTFQQAVVLSGTIGQGNPAVIPGPTDANIALFKQRFRRGFVTNFPAERYIFQGDCTGTMIAPGTDLPCPRAVATPNRPRQTIKEYVLRVGQCAHMKTNASCGRYQRVAFTPTECAARDLNCINQCEVDANPVTTPVAFLKEGRGQVNITPGVNNCAAIMAPAIEFNIAAGSNVYGVLFGGNLNFQGSARLYSIGSLHGGLPGINDPNAFGGEPNSVGDFNLASLEAYAGVSFPLNNLPVVMITGGETQ